MCLQPELPDPLTHSTVINSDRRSAIGHMSNPSVYNTITMTLFQLFCMEGTILLQVIG